MRVPYSWLLELVPGLPEARDLEPVLAKLGLPVGEIVSLPAPPPGVVLGFVRGAEPIPGSELTALEVDIGERTITVVSGAENARAGIGVALALPGARLPASQSVDTDGLGFEVGRRVIQGVESYGFACSPKELAIGEYGGGLLELPIDGTPPGTELETLWPEDEVLDVEVTPNRADALSVLGLARDLAAALGLAVGLPSSGLVATHRPDFPVAVSVLEPGCDRFVARLARNVSVAPSPAWLQRRLMLCGLRPINNLVDASNYIMLELGQPTAAYDLKDLPGGEITVRAAGAGETVETLDGVERTLTADDLVIATGSGEESRVIGVAGVIGAMYSSITSSTRDVVLEAAHFDPVRLRLTARRLGLSTDAVYRFERCVDPNLPVWAANRYMELIAQIAGGEVEPGLFEVGHEQPRLEIAFRSWRVNELLGTEYESDAMRSALERLGCEVEVPGVKVFAGTPPNARTLEKDRQFSGKSFGEIIKEYRKLVDNLGREVSFDWTVRPPTARVDLLIEEDLIEEVARILGYDAIPETLPVLGGGEDDRALGSAMRAKRHLKDVFAGLGFQEAVTYTFTSPLEAERARAASPRLLLRNPQSSERTGLRTALYPSLLGVARTNRALGSLLLFEIGRVFPSPELEEERLGLLLSGAYALPGWGGAGSGLGGGFFALKGLLEAAAARLGDKLEVRRLAEAPLHLHPGIAGELVWNGFTVGEIGALHPGVAADLELPNDTVVAELQLPLPGRPWSFIDPSRHPAARRDLAVIAPRDVPYANLAALVSEGAGLLLEGIEPFDVYSGPQVGAGQRSVAMHLAFRAPGRTLTDAEVDGAMEDVIAAVRGAGYAIRD